MLAYVPPVPHDGPTIAATIHRQAVRAALVMAPCASIASFLEAWNRLMPYGWKLELFTPPIVSAKCEIRLLGPDA